jgi:hypothetical protein
MGIDCGSPVFGKINDDAPAFVLANDPCIHTGKRIYLIREVICIQSISLPGSGNLSNLRSPGGKRLDER